MNKRPGRAGDGVSMCAGRVVTSVLIAIVFAAAFMAQSSWSAPLQAGLERTVPRGDLTRASDDCWWWGLRWQYGWRGYGWYPCWSAARPLAPEVVAPEAVPPDAVTADECLQRWQDNRGKWKTRRVC
jgi:hypothetical protein